MRRCNTAVSRALFDRLPARARSTPVHRGFDLMHDTAACRPTTRVSAHCSGTALHNAAIAGHATMAELLLAHGAKVNAHWRIKTRKGVVQRGCVRECVHALKRARACVCRCLCTVSCLCLCARAFVRACMRACVRALRVRNFVRAAASAFARPALSTQACASVLVCSAASACANAARGVWGGSGRAGPLRAPAPCAADPHSAARPARSRKTLHRRLHGHSESRCR